MQYVHGNFVAGEEVVDLADAQARVEKWCRETAGQRMHGTIQARPVEVFAECEATALLPVPAAYDVPIFTRVKVHRLHTARVTLASNPFEPIKALHQLLRELDIQARRCSQLCGGLARRFDLGQR